MSKLRLTPAEWEIMNAVWELGEAPSVREVLSRAYPHGEKAYTTVQTVMNTLVKKDLLRCKKIGMVNFYRPTRSREAAARSEMRSMVSRVFGGSVPALANSLLSLDSLDLDEIGRIREMLADRERELKEVEE